jgi:hypothetical protein
MEEQFHTQFHSESHEATIADLAQLRQRRCENVAEFIQRFKEVRSRCLTTRITEKEAVELAIVGLAKPARDVAFTIELTSLSHLVQKLTAYEQRHPDLYQDKVKRPVNVVTTVDDDEEEGGEADQEPSTEVAVAEWTRGANPVACKWVKQQEPAKEFDFDVTKTEQIFDLLLKEKQLKLTESQKIPSARELQGRRYCKWHNTNGHNTANCNVLR